MTEDNASFSALGLRPELVAELVGLGYEEPTPIQLEAIPAMLARVDVIGQAATGTGKTAAFALPLLQRLSTRDGARPPAPTTLVLVPTRELCLQVSEAFFRYGRGLRARVLPVYGGAPIGRQLRELKTGVDVVVATPGRAVDLVHRGALQLDHVDCVVLDEADEILDMGFAEDIETLLSATPTGKQTVLFSATIPTRLAGIIKRHLHDPVRITIERPATTVGATPQVRQVAYVVARAYKAAALSRVLDIEAPAAALVFCRTRAEVDQLTETLNGRGYRAEAIHGGLDQTQRERVIGRLRSGTAELLIATDVAARGLDIDTLTHVVNYDMPADVESYVHRIGRVGRAGRGGVAITLVEPREHRTLATIGRVTGQRIVVEKVPTSADLQARRLELTRSNIYQHLLGEDLDDYRVVVEMLADEFDIFDIALAAVKLAHESNLGTTDDVDIPEPLPPAKDTKPRTGKGSGKTKGFVRAGAGAPPAAGVSKLHLSAGRRAGIRPQDIVGAIANETSLSGRQIGAIDITDSFSIVEVPTESVDEVINALSRTKVKGRDVRARRDRGPKH